MKKRAVVGLAAAVCAVFLPASCGMSSEDITSVMDTMTEEYSAGNYEEAYEYIKELDRAYEKMTEEQKSAYDELKSLAEYAHDNAGAIFAKLDAVKGFIDQKVYYEANAEIEALARGYALPADAQSVFDEYKAIVDAGIRDVTVNDIFTAVEAAFGNSDYDTAVSQLNGLAGIEMTEEQRARMEQWSGKLAALSGLIAAQTEYESGKYSDTLDMIGSIDISLLNDTQQEQAESLKQQAESALAEERRKREEANRMTGEKAIELIKAEERKRYGSDVEKFKLKYSYYDKGDYYLVCALVTANANGEDKYRVYKSDGRIEFIGSGSSWAADDAEYFM